MINSQAANPAPLGPSPGPRALAPGWSGEGGRIEMILPVVTIIIFMSLIFIACSIADTDNADTDNSNSSEKGIPEWEKMAMEYLSSDNQLESLKVIEDVDNYDRHEHGVWFKYKTLTGLTLISWIEFRNNGIIKHTIHGEKDIHRIEKYEGKKEFINLIKNFICSERQIKAMVGPKNVEDNERE